MEQQNTPNIVSDGIVELCTSSDSVSSLLAENPTLTPKEAWERLYENWKPSKSPNETKEDLERVVRCGKWGPTQPSELFLKV